jgi:hypothetical protein
VVPVAVLAGQQMVHAFLLGAQVALEGKGRGKAGRASSAAWHHASFQWSNGNQLLHTRHIHSVMRLPHGSQLVMAIIQQQISSGNAPRCEG